MVATALAPMRSLPPVRVPPATAAVFAGLAGCGPVYFFDIVAATVTPTAAGAAAAAAAAAPSTYVAAALHHGLRLYLPDGDMHCDVSWREVRHIAYATERYADGGGGDGDADTTATNRKVVVLQSGAREVGVRARQARGFLKVCRVLATAVRENVGFTDVTASGMQRRRQQQHRELRVDVDGAGECEDDALLATIPVALPAPSPAATPRRAPLSHRVDELVGRSLDLVSSMSLGLRAAGSRSDSSSSAGDSSTNFAAAAAAAAATANGSNGSFSSRSSRCSCVSSPSLGDLPPTPPGRRVSFTPRGSLTAPHDHAGDNDAHTETFPEARTLRGLQAKLEGLQSQVRLCLNMVNATGPVV